MTQNPIAQTKPSRALVDLYSNVSSKWQSTVERLGYPAAYDELILRSIPDDAGPARVLDVGAGTGAFTSALMQSHVPINRVDLLEPSPDMLAICADRIRLGTGRVKPILGGVGAQNVDAMSYDIVLCAHVLEHIEDMQAGIAWIKSRLKSNGVLLLAVSKPHWCTSLVRLRWGHSAYSPQKVVELLGNAGFSKISSGPFSKGPPSRTSFGYTARV